MNFFKMTTAAICAAFLLGFVFCETTTPVEPSPETGIEGRTYTNPDLDFSITAPDGWTIRDTGRLFRVTNNELLVIMKSSDTSETGFSPTANVVYGKSEEETCLDYMGLAQIEYLGSMSFVGFNEIADSLRNITIDTVDRLDACRLAFTISYMDSNSLGGIDTTRMWVEQRFWLRKDYLVVVTMVTPAELYDATMQDFAEIVESIDINLDNSGNGLQKELSFFHPLLESINEATSRTNDSFPAIASSRLFSGARRFILPASSKRPAPA